MYVMSALIKSAVPVVNVCMSSQNRPYDIPATQKAGSEYDTKTSFIFPQRMKKRQRQRRLQTVSKNGLSFELTVPAANGPEALGLVVHDAKCFEIVIDPPTNLDGIDATLRVSHSVSRKTNIVIAVVPAETTDSAYSEYNGGKLLYQSFPTHTLHLSGRLIQSIYLTLEDAQFDGNCDTPIYVLKFNYGLGLMQRLFPQRYSGLSFYPPDARDIIRDGIDSTTFPQGSSQSYKTSGYISSSRVAKLLGYYVPENDKNWSLAFQEGLFVGWRGAAVRFGQQNEITSLLLYLKRNPEAKFYETGASQNVTEGHTLTAQPDGLIDHDGLIEFKASMKNCNFEGSYIAQAIWEMLCTNRSWCDIVRYCQRPFRDPNTGLWSQRRETRQVRIFRCPEMESKIVTLALASKELEVAGKTEEFVRLVHSAPYKAIRKHLDDLAAQANAQTPVLPVDAHDLKPLEEYRQLYLIDRQNGDSLLDRIEGRQGRIFALQGEDENVAEMRQLVLEQIQDLADFIK
jgi:hypothetical protein